MDIKSTLNQFVEQILPIGAYILEISLIKQSNKSIIIVLVDTEQGITIDQCATISRQLANFIEEQQMFGESSYTLEVSSPGVDYPLTQPRQYIKNINRKLQVLLEDGSEHIGILKSVNEENIEIEPEVDTKKVKKQKPTIQKVAENATAMSISYQKIKKAQVLVSFK